MVAYYVYQESIMNNKTTITITDTSVSITTSEQQAMELIKKNPNCLTRTDAINDDWVCLTYNPDQLMTLTTLIKTSKKRSR